MSLVNLLNVPRTPSELNQWSWENKSSHLRIIQAIQQQKGITLQQYLLDPINENDIPTFLEREQQQHNDMNQALGLQGSDLDSVDWKDEKQREAWFWQDYQEHLDAESALKI